MGKRGQTWNTFIANHSRDVWACDFLQLYDVLFRPICERFLGSVRRACLDHVIILSERQLRRVLKEYVEIYFNRARPHQGLGQAIPVGESRSVREVGGKVVSFPILGALHHDYRLAA